LAFWVSFAGSWNKFVAEWVALAENFSIRKVSSDRSTELRNEILMIYYFPSLNAASRYVELEISDTFGKFPY